MIAPYQALPPGALGKGTKLRKKLRGKTESQDRAGRLDLADLFLIKVKTGSFWQARAGQVSRLAGFAGLGPGQVGQVGRQASLARQHQGRFHVSNQFETSCYH
ncbi:hypothetical protein PPACK8108_LOCUS4315 [Phakopsora pachyrhizi]|uniref:Uncharacterized protein n=1 Tax=Phakopsora pachyrhizi TaxID=170000 RepID=A0AAV0ANT2_PHAPC|nr:hypothetical protein PPACK8108_LOCUS4315 [Phakopsora pachyrhizi]